MVATQAPLTRIPSFTVRIKRTRREKGEKVAGPPLSVNACRCERVITLPRAHARLHSHPPPAEVCARYIVEKTDENATSGLGDNELV